MAFVSKFMCIGAETRNEAKNGSKNAFLLGILRVFPVSKERLFLEQCLYLYYDYLTGVFTSDPRLSGYSETR
jgi:hypothetical protein